MRLSRLIDRFAWPEVNHACRKFHRDLAQIVGPDVLQRLRTSITSSALPIANPSG